MMKSNERALVFVLFIFFLSLLSLLDKYLKGQERFYHASNMIDILSENLEKCRSINEKVHGHRLHNRHRENPNL